MKTRRENTHRPNVRLGWRALAVALLLASQNGILLRAMPPASPVQKDGASGTIVGVPWTGAPGITETVAEIMERERHAPPILAGQALVTKPEFDLKELPRNEKPSALPIPQWPSPEGKKGTVLPYNPQTVGTSFLGTQVSESGFIPPDSVGAVGPTQVLVPSNGRIKVFDRSGVLGGLNVSSDTFFASVRNGSGTSDPRVNYDRLSGRWFLTMINVSTPNRVMIAVSSGPTITNTSSFTFFQFQHDLVGTTPNSDTGGFADYDTLGVDANALYIGVNVFNAAGNAFLGTTGFVVRKADLLASILTVTAFRQLTNGSTQGPLTPQGVTNDDPSATEGYFIGVDTVFFSQLDMIRISNPGGVPSASSNIVVGGTVPATDFPLDQPAQGSTHALDSLDDRLYAAAIHKNRSTGISTLWTAHNIGVNSSGVATSPTRNGSRWYEIGSLTTSPAVVQAGTLFDSAASNPMGYWIPSMAMSGQGHVVLGSSRAGNNEHAEIAVAGRLAGDSLGTLQAPTLAQSSSTAYNVQSVTPQRWGDYSVVTVDPNDDMTMWTFQEYCNATNSWGVRAIQLLAPPPATPASASPSSMAQGATGDVVVTGTVVSGSGFFDPGSAFPNRISAAVNGGGVTVNSVTFTDPTHVTLNVTVSGGAALGSRTVTVTNPDGQAMTSAGGILTITTSCTPPAAPVAGNNGPICAGETLQLTASTVASATYAWTGPNGFASALQNPSIPNATAAASGTYSVTATVTGCVSPAGTTTATVNVCAPAAAGTLLPDGRAVTQTLPAGGHAHRATVLAGRSYSVEVDVPFDGATTVGTGGPLPGLAIFRADGTTALATAPVSRTACGPATASRLTFTPSAADVAGGPVQIQVLDSLANGYRYRVRLEETSLFCARWSISGYNAFIDLQNTSDCAISGEVALFDQSGASLTVLSFALAAGAATQIAVPTGLSANFGAARLRHDGPPGSLAAGIYMVQPGSGPGANFRWPFHPVRHNEATDGR